MDYPGHIETRQGVLGGKPVIRGQPISVGMLLSSFGRGLVG